MTAEGTSLCVSLDPSVTRMRCAVSADRQTNSYCLQQSLLQSWIIKHTHVFQTVFRISPLQAILAILVTLSVSVCVCLYMQAESPGRLPPELSVTKVQVQCCFTSTETIRIIMDGETGTATSTFTQLLSSDTGDVSHHLIYLKENRTKEESRALSVGMKQKQ